MIRVALETSAAFMNKAGTGRVAVALSQALQNGRFSDFTFYTLGQSPRFLRLSSRWQRQLFILWWEWLYAPSLLAQKVRRLQPDILHCLFPIPLSGRIRRQGCTIVTNIHDLFPLLHPDWFPPLMRARLRRWLRRAVNYSDHFIAISNYTRHSLQEHFSIDPHRLHVAHLGHDFLPAGSDWSAPGPFILAVGTIEPRKNLAAVFRAYARLKAAAVPLPSLYIAGETGWGRLGLAPLLDSLNLTGDITFLGYVPDEKLAALYRQARLLVYPSLAEGFGLPVVEAMAAGCPVIATNTSALPEVVGQAGLLIDPNNETALAAAIERLLNDEELARQMGEHGRLRAAQFTWAGCAEKVVEIYADIV